MDKRLLDYRPEMEYLPQPRLVAGRGAGEDELMFAATLLEVAGEDELDGYFDDMITALGRSGRIAPGTPAGQSLRRALSGAARIVLAPRNGGPASPGAPVRPLIEMLGRDGGADLKARAARVFGIELEGMSPEDKEFELARRFVGFAADAIRRADAATPGRAGLETALQQAARQHAPGLLRCAARQSGRWRREGSRIIVSDC